MKSMLKKSNSGKKSGVFLLSIGDELLDGRTTNSNATWFGEQLRLHGIPVDEVRVVSDRLTDIVTALKEGRKYPIVLATGGLGPTNDDRTMEAAAKALHRKLVRTKESLNHIRERYEGRGLPLTEVRLKLANIPEQAKVLPNPTGSAPGVYVKEKSSHFFFLPGPPIECHPMFLHSVLPKVRKLHRGKKLIVREFWRTFGRGESEVYQRIQPFIHEAEKKHPLSLTFGVHISFPYIDVTMEAWHLPRVSKPPTKELQSLTDSITTALSPLTFTRKRESLVNVVSQHLKEKKRTLAIAESCTGGLLSKLFTDLPGSSSIYIGGVVSYANEAKKILLQVSGATLASSGAVSEATVREMAEHLRVQLRTDFALALSGISGPEGGSATKPVGTIYVALSSAKGTKTLHQVILSGKGSRDQNRIIAAHLALNALRAEF